MDWRPPSLSELTLNIFYMRLTHLGLEAFMLYILTKIIVAFLLSNRVNARLILMKFGWLTIYCNQLSVP